jgi:serine/threonine protein kinase
MCSLKYRRGGQATVFSVAHRQAKEEEAAKIWVGNTAQLKKEFDHPRSINHVNIAVPTAGYQDEMIGCIIMPLFDKNLHDYLVERKKRKSILGQTEAEKLARGITSGVQELHSHQLIHRDIKCANILMSGDVPKIADFGLSRKLDELSAALTMNIGTPMYRAPETLTSSVASTANLGVAQVSQSEFDSGPKVIVPFSWSEDKLPGAKKDERYLFQPPVDSLNTPLPWISENRDYKQSIPGAQASSLNAGVSSSSPWHQGISIDFGKVSDAGEEKDEDAMDVSDGSNEGVGSDDSGSFKDVATDEAKTKLPSNTGWIVPHSSFSYSLSADMWSLGCVFWDIITHTPGRIFKDGSGDDLIRLGKYRNARFELNAEDWQNHPVLCALVEGLVKIDPKERMSLQDVLEMLDASLGSQGSTS